MRRHKCVIDQLSRRKDTLRPDPCGERERVDLLLDLLQGFTLHRSDTSGEYYGVSSSPTRFDNLTPDDSRQQTKGDQRNESSIIRTVTARRL